MGLVYSIAEVLALDRASSELASSVYGIPRAPQTIYIDDVLDHDAGSHIIWIYIVAEHHDRKPYELTRCSELMKFATSAPEDTSISQASSHPGPQRIGTADWAKL